MSVSQEAGVARLGGGRDGMPEKLPDPVVFKRLGMPVRRAISRTRQWLLAAQDPDGSWCAELEGDSILESETILLLAFLGREDSELARRTADYLIEKQLPDGGWSMVPEGRVEISASVKAYFALKLTGHRPNAEYMQRARRAILAHGGADAVNSYTRFYLALLGQISYAQCPAVPPEVVLLPKWFPANLYAVSSWSRTIIVPLSIVSAMRPVRELDARLGIRELFLKAPKDWPALRCPGLPGGTGLLSWDRFFRTVDRGLKFAQRWHLLPLRRRAIRKAQRWMLERFEGSDGLGAIYPPIVWSVLALHCLGYDEDSPEVQECYAQLEALTLEDEETDSVRLQPCKSPVWDTAITLRTLLATGVQPDNPAIGRAVDWLLNKQVLRRGDWSHTVRAEPGGWSFEYANDFYPDNDDTGAVLTALQALFGNQTAIDESDAKEPDSSPCRGLPPELRIVDERIDAWLDAQELPEAETKERQAARMERSTEAIERGLRWLLAMQNRDGGWGAFDRNNHREFLCYVPFADHNAMIDPSTPDLTGGVLETLGKLGRRVGNSHIVRSKCRAADRAVEYLRTSQEADGSWFGRWGVNYIYGTWKALSGLASVGVPADDPMMIAGANWLLAHQQPSGGWGESADTYDHPERRGQGVSTASQTAWAIMGLLAAGYHEHDAVARGIRYLIYTQRTDGIWDEPEFTGTGFPRVFYLRYHYYPIYFPLLALSEWAVHVEPLLSADEPPVLGLVT